MNETEPPRHVNPSALKLEPAPDGSVTTPVRAPAMDFLGDWMESGERVVGVALMREARAYPLRHLEVHEVALDTFPGGVPVVVIYCPRTGLAAAYDRRVNGETLDFDTTATRAGGSIVLADRGTGSQWLGFTGECVEGPSAGARLNPLPASLVTWRAWTRAHPSSKVMRAPSSEREYDLEEKWVAYARSDRVEHAITHSDPRIRAKTAVAGFHYQGEPFAVTMSLLESLGELEIPIKGGLIYMSHNDGFVGAEDASGRELLTRVAYWFAWKDFNPSTRAFTRQGELTPRA